MKTSQLYVPILLLLVSANPLMAQAPAVAPTPTPMPAPSDSIQSTDGTCWVFRDGDRAVVIRVGTPGVANTYDASLATYTEGDVAYIIEGTPKTITLKKKDNGFRIREGTVDIGNVTFFRGRGLRPSDRAVLRLKPSAGPTPFAAATAGCDGPPDDDMGEEEPIGNMPPSTLPL